ncbi:zinc finger domain-containing protein [Streptomyces sp. CA-251387]|uniref:zinc finger domain-containing protein n=1 Tax=Streptomyces sp. CA-251387 TaxID=3240064 RepID=UPI003D8E91ED
MLRFQASAQDLLRSRFALSPAFELANLLRTLHSGGYRLLPEAWAARPGFGRLRRETELDAALALHTSRSGADFVAVPPKGLAQTWADDLAAIRATPPAQARTEIAHITALQPARDPRVREVLAAPDAVERIAAALDRAWHELLASDWPQLCGGAVGLAAAVEQFDCPTCEVPAGSTCRTRGGKVAPKYHTPRFMLVPQLRAELEVRTPADRGQPRPPVGEGPGRAPWPALRVRVLLALDGLGAGLQTEALLTSAPTGHWGGGPVAGASRNLATSSGMRKRALEARM